MAWRSVVINQPARLRREQFALLVEQDSGSARVPFEDIAIILLNHREITMGHAVLSACGEYGIGLFTTGENHQPNALLLPFLQHSRATRMLRLQLALDKPSMKQIWSSIIRVKIMNQADCLRRHGRAGADELNAMVQWVQSGDKQNKEAQASAYYFPQLFGRNFHRQQNIWVNAALDYGYAIFRGACARALVAHGFLPSIGVFHRSEQNAFNLADDLIEPYRAIVDYHVAAEMVRHADEDTLSPEDKVALVALLNVDVAMPRGVMNALASIEQASMALARAYEAGGDQHLEWPRMIGNAQHRIDA